MNDIFISYSKNEHWVSSLADALKAEGYKVWWDRSKLVAGDNYAKEIENALKNSKCVITVWSQESTKSLWVRDETRVALKLKRLVTVLSESVTPPLPYGSIHSTNLKSWDGNRHNREYQQLLKGIKKYSKPSYPKLPLRNIILAKNYCIDNDDNTVLDKNTRLMWKMYSEGQDSKPHKYRMVRKYTWADANKRFKSIPFAGYYDWRLPSIEELRTLVYCSNGTPQHIANTEGCDISYKVQSLCNKPTIDHSAFPNTLPDMYWTSSPYYDEDKAYALFFNAGYDEERYKHIHGCVRLVRHTPFA